MRVGLPHAGRAGGGILHPRRTCRPRPGGPAPGRRGTSRGAQLPTAARLCTYGLLRTGCGRGSWAIPPRPGYRQCAAHGAADMRGKGRSVVYHTPSPLPAYKYKTVSLFIGIRVKYEIRSVKVPRKMIGRSVAVKVTFTLKNTFTGLQKMAIGALKSDFSASSFCRYKQTVLYSIPGYMYLCTCTCTSNQDKAYICRELTVPTPPTPLPRLSWARHPHYGSPLSVSLRTQGYP